MENIFVVPRNKACGTLEMLGLEGKEWVNSVVMYPFQYIDCTCISINYCSFSFFNCHVYALSYRLLGLQQNFKFLTFYSLTF